MVPGESVGNGGQTVSELLNKNFTFLKEKEVNRTRKRAMKLSKRYFRGGGATE